MAGEDTQERPKRPAVAGRMSFRQGQPCVAQTPCSQLQPVRVLASGLSAPLSDGLVRNGNGPLRRKVLQVSEAGAEAV